MSSDANYKVSEVRVMGFGTFDALHQGHLSYFDQLNNLGDEVTIVIARDHNVQKIKGNRPRDDEKKRLKAVKDSKKVSNVVLGSENDFYEVLYKYKPDIIGLGYDQRANIQEIKKSFPHIKIHRLKAYRPDIYKSSLVKKNQKLAIQNSK